MATAQRGRPLARTTAPTTAPRATAPRATRTAPGRAGRDQSKHGVSAEQRAANEIIDQEWQRLAAADAARTRQFGQWDNLLESAGFQEYLDARGLMLREAVPDLPRDVQAEQCALGAMMMDRAAAQQGVLRLRPLMFSYGPHSLILHAMASIHRNQQSGKKYGIDDTTVASVLLRRKQLEVIGDHAYLLALIQTCPCPANIDGYIDAIVETARLRGLYALGDCLSRSALEAEAFPQQLTNAARKTLDQIEEHGDCDLTAIFAATK